MTIQEILNIYTLAEAAKLLGIKPDTLKHQCQQGKHNAVKMGNTWLIKIK
jgi:excisionase family DNA binding protein